MTSPKLQIEISADPTPAKRDLTAFEQFAKKTGKAVANDLSNVAKQIEKTEKEIAGAAQSYLVKTEIRMQKSLQMMQANEKAMAQAVGGSARHFGGLERAARAANDHIRQIGTEMKGLGSSMNASMIGGAALVGFAASARQTARDIATIGDEAKRAGIGVKAFQELRFVAEQNRVSVDALTDGMKELSLRADEFVITGSGSGAEAFKRLGLTSDGLAKKLKDPSALFSEIIGKMAQMDRAAQIRIADEVFGGTGGEQFVQLIAQGEAGIRRTIEEANRLGIVMDQAMIAKAAEVDRQFSAISQTVGTKLKGAIVEASSALGIFFDGFNKVQDQQRATLEASRAMSVRQRDAAQARIDKGAPFDFMLEPFRRQVAQSQGEIAKIDATLAKLPDTAKAAGDASKQLGDALGYVQKNGGASGQVLDTYAKSVQDLKTRLAAQVADAQLAIDYAGKSEGALAAARFQADGMADALQAAKAAGKDAVDPALASYIADQAAKYGTLTGKLKENTEAEQKRQDVLDKAKDRRERINTAFADIDFDRSLIGLSDGEAAIREQLHSLDVDFGSFEGQRIAAGLRLNDQLRETQEEMRRVGEEAQDAWRTFAESVASGQKPLEALLSTFSQVGSQYFSKGFDSLTSGLFDTGKSAAVATTRLRTVQASLPQTSGVGSDYAALQPTSTVRSASSSAALSSSPAVSIWRFFESKGLSKVAIAGIMGNAFGESAYNPRAVGDSGKALGVFQWNDRSQALKDFAGGDWQDLGKQLDFAWKELNTTERATLERLKQSTSVGEATQAFLGFERPRGYSASDPTRSHNYSGRLSAAEAAYGKYGDGVTSKEVSDGVLDAQKKIISGRVPIPTQRPTTTEGGVGIDPAKIDRFSGGMQALGAGLGIFSQGFQSQSPLMGGVTGAISGVGASASLAAAFGLAAGPLAPVGAAVGALVGAVGGSKGQRRTPIEKRAAMDAAWNDHSERKAA